MKLLTLLGFLAVFVAAAAAWTKEDHEIFDLVSAIEGAEGKGTTFYSWLDVPSTASNHEISRAYRKKSVQLHPDKNPGVKGAHERFARLGVVSKILRDQEGRKRYDFFYKNGVPRWRGTGYYYSRFRPGLGTVLVFLTILSSGLQYLVQRMNYNRDLKRVEWIVEQAKTAAWGAKLVPGEGQRKVKVNLGGPTRFDEDGNAIPGRMMDMVVEGNDVYVLEPDGSLLAVDSSTAIPPSIKRTWFLTLVSSTFSNITKRGASNDADANGEDIDGTEDGSEVASDAPGSGTVTPQEGLVSGSQKGGRAVVTSMAGGRRRKAVSRKK